MLSILPFFLTFEMIAPFLLRLALAIVLLLKIYLIAGKNVKHLVPTFKKLNNLGRTYMLAYGVLAIFFILGLMTQVAALLTMFVLIFEEYKNKTPEKMIDYEFFALLTAICLSLLVLGPGIFSLDLPL